MSDGDAARTALLAVGDICFDAMMPRHLARIGRAHEVLGPLKPTAVATEAVHFEWTVARVTGCSELPEIVREVELTKDQVDEAEDLRLERSTEKDTKNRGEAHSVIWCRDNGRPLVTHDEQGISWARRLGVEVYTAIDVLALVAARGALKPGKAWTNYHRLCEPMNAMDSDKRGMFGVVGWVHVSPKHRDDFMELVSDVKGHLSRGDTAVDVA